MRAFVAVFPPPEIRRVLVEAARRLPRTGEVRWVRPANVHLTLKFLGEVPEEDLDRVAEALEPVCDRHEPFEVEPTGFGAFPSTRRGRILWAGIGEGSERLRALAEDVEDSLERLGFEREARAYFPHLTLGRARGRPVALTTTETPSSVPGFSVRHMELVRSEPGEAGTTYSTQATCLLSEDRD
jgi:2'-5' RNA ligase